MVKYSEQYLDLVFGALSDQTRRAILARLATGACTVSELAEPFSISLPATSKHLRILGNAGLITRTREGRIRRCTLEPQAMESAAAWIAEQRAAWDVRLDALEQYLVDIQTGQEST